MPSLTTVRPTPQRRIVLALIDESVREDGRGFHYLIACTLVSDASEPNDPSCTILREELRGILNGRHRPFRWKNEGVVKKNQIIDLIVSSELFTIAAISQPSEGFLQRRNRSWCLVAVCRQLASEGVDAIIVESRSGQDHDDVQTVEIARAQGILPANFPSLQFRDKTENLLWLPDAMGGAIREAEARTDNSWIHRLTEGGGILDIHRLPLQPGLGSRNRY